MQWISSFVLMCCVVAKFTWAKRKGQVHSTGETAPGKPMHYFQKKKKINNKEVYAQNNIIIIFPNKWVWEEDIALSDCNIVVMLNM